jgi:hypothetical protein
MLEQQVTQRNEIISYQIKSNQFNPIQFTSNKPQRAKAERSSSFLHHSSLKCHDVTDLSSKNTLAPPSRIVSAVGGEDSL